MRIKQIASMALLLGLTLGCVLYGTPPTPLPEVAGEMPAPTTTLMATEAPVEGLSAPLPTPDEAGVTQIITLTSPRPGAAVENPILVEGATTLWPFEATLVVHVYDAQGELRTTAPIMVQGEMGEPTTFSAYVTHSATPGAGRVEVVDLSARDGSIIASAAVDVRLIAPVTTGLIEIPAAQSPAVLPLRIFARVGAPGQQVTATLTWQDGTTLAESFTTLSGLDGRGLLITALSWPATAAPAPTLPTQSARLEIHAADGELLAQQDFTLLGSGDAELFGVTVYWLSDGALVPVQVQVPRTQRIGSAALEVLLWGPPPGGVGFETAIPSPAEVLSAPNRGANWGEQVVAQRLAIVEGVAEVDLSAAVLAYGDDTARAHLIRQQIEQTLLQFSTVNQVVITVEGSPGMLEP